MVRSLLVLAGAMAALAPTVCAQGVTVCVFQADKGMKIPDNDDAQEVATALSALKLPNGDAINAIPIDGISAENENAEARKRSCNFVAELWRTDMPPDSPLFAGTLQPGTNAGQYSRETVNQMESKSNTTINYSLRKTDSDKKIAHAVSDDNKPASVAKTLAKKIGKAQ